MRIDTETLVIGSGAGGSITATTLARAGRDVVVVEEGPWVAADAVEAFSLDEMVAKYRNGGGAATLGLPPIAYVEGCCVGGSTEVNSGLWAHIPAPVADEWGLRFAIDEFSASVVETYAKRIEEELCVSKLPGAPPPSSSVLVRGAEARGWRSTEFPRVFTYDAEHRGTKQTMTRTLIPAAVTAGARIIPDCRIDRLVRRGDRVVGVRGKRRDASGTEVDVSIHAEHVFVCGGAIQSPALLRRSGIRRNIGTSLKLHPTIRVAARFPYELDHADVPMHRITEFAPGVEIGGSASRRSYVAMALADATPDYDEALADWKNIFIYYAAIHDGTGRVRSVPGLRSPVVTYRLGEGDMSRLARGLVLLGEALFAAGATELYPSLSGGPIVRRPDELGQWWDAVTRSRANLMTIHMTSSVGMGEDRASTGADSFGRVWGIPNLRVNDASVLPDAPGVNPQCTVMSIALRNVEEFLATT
jgi:choline dehydrogenase-like flavoprotein